MCRIFGFRSILQSGVHRSLLDADNSIIHQSDRHPDGWGVAYYHMGSPHLVKLDSQAKKCKIFERISGVVSSNTVITHIRKSTVGSVGPLNTHPFQFGPWVFAHNGNIDNFEKTKGQFLERIDKNLRPFIFGETDSESLFYLLLTVLKRHGYLEDKRGRIDFQKVLEDFVREFQSIAGPLNESKGDYDRNYLTFVLTDGSTMLAFNGGQQLYYSTHKEVCSDRQTCHFFNPICEVKAERGQKVHHLLISSEVIKNENTWSGLSFGEYVFIDKDFIFNQGQVAL